MFPLTEKTAKISGYVPEARLANRQWKWVSILFPRATWKLYAACTTKRRISFQCRMNQTMWPICKQVRELEASVLKDEQKEVLKMAVYERLVACCDSKFRDFQSKLVPNIPKEMILGVKTPDMRKIAKEVKGTKEAEVFLAELPHKYYEENLVHFFLIAMIRDFDECVKAVETFLPYVDCWPICDQSNPKVFSKNHEKLLPLIQKWICSEHVYTVRFGIRMLMNEFLGEDFRLEYLEWVAAVKREEYYIKMMVAWFFATALAKRYDESVVFIEERRLEPWTHRKAIQKAVESFRVSDEHKEYLRTLR